MNSLIIKTIYKKLRYNNVKMLVFDMAGTTVNEGGIVYKTLYSTMKDFNLDVKKDDIHHWHGKNKYEVLEHFLSEKYNKNIATYKFYKLTLFENFNNNLKKNYFDSSKIKLMHPNMPDLFNKIRERDIKITLNTGYNKDIQKSIIDRLHMERFIDDYISSEEVCKGRPEPYMINSLTQKHSISSKEIIKIGDTTNDILEGINANCLTSIGVLTGADTKKDLSVCFTNWEMFNYPHPRICILNSVMDIGVL